jgi:hypothetical protein
MGFLKKLVDGLNHSEFDRSEYPPNSTIGTSRRCIFITTLFSFKKGLTMKERLLSQKVTGISLGERAHIALGSIHLRYMAKKGRFSVPASVNLR